MTAAAWDVLVNGGILAWLGMMLVASATARLLIRWFPVIRETIAVVEGPRLESLDGLRGFLGVSVMLHHVAATWVLLRTGQWALPDSRFLVHTGQTAVALFFMITAFLFWGRILERRDRMDWAKFFVSRIFRLYPVYLVALAIVVIASLALSEATGRSGPFLIPLMKWLTMLGSPDMLGVDSGHVIADVTWTLRYEWFFYIALPVLAPLVGVWNTPAALACGLLLTALYLACSQMVDPVIVISFLGGIAAAHYVQVPRLRALASGWQAAFAGLAALIAVVALSDSGFGPWPTVGLGVFFAVVASGNDLFGLLSRPSLLWLGEITYAIYLFHGIFLFLTSLILVRFGIESIVTYAVAMVPLTILVTGVASGLFLFIERPGIQAGRRFGGRMSAALSPARR